MMVKGSIVLIPFPFTDRSGTKLRPAVVLAAGNNHPDIIVAFLSSRERNDSGAFKIRIRANKKNGLKVDSVLIYDKIATLDSELILGRIGYLSDKDMNRLNSRLKKLFDL